MTTWMQSLLYCWCEKRKKNMVSVLIERLNTPQSKYSQASNPFPLPKLTFSSSLFPLLQPSPLRFPSGLDVWYLLHVQSQVSGQNSPLDHLQSGLVLVQGETAQDLVSLREKQQTERHLSKCRTAPWFSTHEGLTVCVYAQWDSKPHEEEIICIDSADRSLYCDRPPRGWHDNAHTVHTTTQINQTTCPIHMSLDVY